MLLRTPNARDGEPRGTQPPEKRPAGGHQPSLADQMEHLDPACSYCGESRTPSRCDNCDAGPTRAQVFAGDWGDDFTLLGTPTARDHKGSGQGERLEESERRGQVEAQVLSLLPTPACNDMGAAYTPDQWDAWTERMKAAHNNGNGHGPSLNIEAQRIDMLLPTPTAESDGNTPETHLARKPGRTQVTNLEVMARGDLLPTTTADHKASGAADYTTGHAGTTLTDATVRQPSRWGKYAAAIARWERITRPAPEPTNVTAGYLKARAKRLARLDKRPVGMRGSLKVRRQLAARFSEWMMGVPLGWITDVPGVTRNEALKAAGNGVVPQQAAEALRFLLTMPTGREIADAHEPLDLLELMEVSGS